MFYVQKTRFLCFYKHNDRNFVASTVHKTSLYKQICCRVHVLTQFLTVQAKRAYIK